MATLVRLLQSENAEEPIWVTLAGMVIEVSALQPEKVSSQIVVTPSGIVMPRHHASGVQGDLICTEFNTRRLSRHRLSKAGSTQSAETSTFLESDQTDFHPTDVIEDADGSMFNGMDTSHEVKVFRFSSVEYLLGDFEPQAFGFKNLRRQIQTNCLNQFFALDPPDFIFGDMIGHF